jgi:hypothetical protein
MLRYAWQPEWRLRLVKPGLAKWGGLEPHSAIFPCAPGEIVNLRGNMIHDSFQSVEEHLLKSLNLARIAAESNQLRGSKTGVVRLLMSTAGSFIKQYMLKLGILDGKAGVLAAASMACYTMMKHIIWMEKQTVDALRRRTHQ